MLLGSPMPAPYSDWRFVESDLYDTTSRVQEYDPDARIVRQNGTGILGLARWHKNSMVIAGGTWMFAREIVDLDTDKVLTGEPDGRVLRFQRATDGWRFNTHHRVIDWHRQARLANERKEERRQKEIYEDAGLHAEEYIGRARRDAGKTDRAFIRQGVPA